MIRSTNLRGLETAWLQTEQEVTQSEFKPIFIFLHGCPDNADTWNAQFDHYSARGYTAIAPFARGVDPSSPANDQKRYGLDAIALDNLEILRAVDQEGDRRVVVVGHDIGAIHAWKLARLLGKRLAALVIVNGPELSQMARRLSNSRQLAKSWYIALFQIPLVPELILKRWEGALLSRAQKFAGMPADTATSIYPFLAQYRQAARAIPKILRTKEAPLTAPVLVLWGKDDAFLEIPSANEFTRLANNVTVRIIEGDHWLHYNQPDRVNDLIDKFLEENLK